MIIFFLVVGLIIGTVLFFLHWKDEHKVRKTLILTISFSFTLLGFVLTIADDYFSQYDYNPEKIKNYEKQKKNGVPFDSLIGKKTEIAPEYIFVLDLSKSTKSMKVKMTASIQEQIDAIVETGRCGTKENTFGVDRRNEEIPYNNLLQVRLLYSLIQLEKLNYDESQLVYSVVYFAAQPDRFIPNSEKLSKRIDESFDDILTRDFDGQNTDFIKILEHLDKVYFSKNNIKENGISYRNPFGRKDYIVVFLSDYLHDNGNNNQYENEEKINSIIKRIEDANVNLKLYTILEKDDVIKNNANLIRIDKILQNLSYSEALDLRGFENNLQYPIVLSTPFPFFYSNRIYEDSLKSKIIFNKYQGISVGLGNYSSRSRQEYRLYQQGIDQPSRLSNSIKSIIVRRNDTVKIEIFGYIPAPYKSPDIILEDHAKGVQYYLPVVFYKNCPITAVYMLHIIIGITLFSIGLFAVAFFKNKDLIIKRIKSIFKRIKTV